MTQASEQVTVYKAIEVLAYATEEDLRKAMHDIGGVRRVMALRALREAIRVMSEECDAEASREVREMHEAEQAKQKRRDGIARVKLGITE